MFKNIFLWFNNKKKKKIFSEKTLEELSDGTGISKSKLKKIIEKESIRHKKNKNNKF